MELVYSKNFFPMQLYLYSAEKQKYFSVLRGRHTVLCVSDGQRKFLWNTETFEAELYQGFKTVLRVSTVTSAGHNVQTGVLSALTISTIMINTCSGETTVQAKERKKDRKEKCCYRWTIRFSKYY